MLINIDMYFGIVNFPVFHRSKGVAFVDHAINVSEVTILAYLEAVRASTHKNHVPQIVSFHDTVSNKV